MISNKLLMRLVALAVIIAGGFYAVKNKEQIAAHVPALKKSASAEKTETAVAPPAVTVAKATKANFVETALISGSLVARDEIIVAPEVEGLRILELFADEGSVVKKGQVLARLVSDQLDAQMAQNDAGLARATAAIAQAKSNITSAEARVKEAKANFERAEPLKKSGYLSNQAFEQREATLATAEAQLAATQDGLRAAEADKAQTEAQRRELTWRRGNTEVKAPEDGIVSRRNARIGAAATAQAIVDPMFRIISKGEVELDAEIVETELQRVKPGQKAQITVPGFGDVEGTVRLISPEIDKATRLGRVKIFLGEKPEFRLGAFARGKIETAKSRGTAIPTAALIYDQGQTFVQVVDSGNKIKRKGIKTGLATGDLVEVVDGLSENDVVVARAGSFLRDGDIIRPVFPDAKISEVK